MGVEPNFKFFTVDEARQEFGGLFKDADYDGVKKVSVHYDSGWAEAKDVLDNVVAAVVSAGVKFVAAEVLAIIFNKEGNQATGIRTTTGETISATKIILSNGAGLQKLMADSAPDRDDFQPGPRVATTSRITGLASSDSDVSRFMTSPVCSKETGLKGWTKTM